jgi:hypothetical protein
MIIRILKSMRKASRAYKPVVTVEAVIGIVITMTAIVLLRR